MYISHDREESVREEERKEKLCSVISPFLCISYAPRPEKSKCAVLLYHGTDAKRSRWLISGRSVEIRERQMHGRY